MMITNDIIYIIMAVFALSISKLTTKFSNANMNEEQKELEKELLRERERDEFKTLYADTLGLVVFILATVSALFFDTIAPYLAIGGVIFYIMMLFIFWKLKVREIEKEYNQKIDELYPDDYTKVRCKRIMLIGNTVTVVLFFILFLYMYYRQAFLS